MPITSINFSTSQENINKIGLRSWKKFGAEYQVEAGENLEDAKKALKDFVYTSIKKQPDELPEEQAKEKEPQVLDNTESDMLANIAFESLKQRLEEFEFREDAEAYLLTTEFKYSVEAKKIINSKPSKK